MTAHHRKLVGSVAILVFVLLYVGAMGWIGAHLPPLWWVQLAFYLVAGTAWGLPLLPLLSWMNRGR
jgi:hypothetical protein